MQADPLHLLVRNWADAFNARDPDTLVALADPEVDCHPLQISLRGHFKGHDGIRRWMEELSINDPGHRIRADSVRTLDDGRVVLFGAICVDDTPVSPFALLVVARSGNVLTTRSYLSDQETLDRLGLLAHP